jgi:hypothetical protein
MSIRNIIVIIRTFYFKRGIHDLGQGVVVFSTFSGQGVVIFSTFSQNEILT